MMFLSNASRHSRYSIPLFVGLRYAEPRHLCAELVLSSSQHRDGSSPAAFQPKSVWGMDHGIDDISSRSTCRRSSRSQQTWWNHGRTGTLHWYRPYHSDMASLRVGQVLSPYQGDTRKEILGLHRRCTRQQSLLLGNTYSSLVSNVCS